MLKINNIPKKIIQSNQYHRSPLQPQPQSHLPVNLLPYHFYPPVFSRLVSALPPATPIVCS